jgi:hypothetical protein
LKKKKKKKYDQCDSPEMNGLVDETQAKNEQNAVRISVTALSDENLNGIQWSSYPVTGDEIEVDYRIWTLMTCTFQM